MPLQYSAAKTSTSNRSPSKSPIKKFQRDAKKILPSQRVYKQNLLKKNSSSSPSPPSSPTKGNAEKLQVSDYNVQLDYQLPDKDDIVVAIDSITGNRWSESTSLHDKYRLGHLHGLPLEEAISSIKGLSSVSKADLLKFRQALPSGLVTVSQMYSIFNSQGNTFVDKSIEMNIQRGLIRKFVISNASPVISRSFSNFPSKVSYGFENVDVIAKSDDFYDALKVSIAAVADKKDCARKSLERFYEFVQSHPQELFVSSSSFDDEGISNLVQLGYITLTSNYFNEQESHFAISYPGCGTYLRLVNEGRLWLVKTLNKTKHKELLEEDIFKKYSGVNMEGDPKLNNFRKPFYGYDLHWILADALGSGIIEVFNTPVGRGWRLTGKI
ncbi:uncharacterized protein LODBEIA_P36710 [Lodderomyces beijingensis]|uniref:Uncharacterized protein n=1 Tax=Lodderomyces beijingensis TaxID=1775926 RepID=A0ABP0ZMS8_9ASCO